MIEPRVIVALDFAEERPLLNLVEQLDPTQCRLKVGKEAFVRFGPALLARLHERGFEVFLDLKFHDIPNTVAAAVRAAAEQGVWMCNVHALGGARMMAAADAARREVGAPMHLIGVTVLTSMSDAELAEIGLPPVAESVPKLAQQSLDAGLDGVVCSALDIRALRGHLSGDKKCLCVTPGIRLASDDAQDQTRVVTPQRGRELGSDYLVVGRSITAADDPLGVLTTINAAIADT